MPPPAPSAEAGQRIGAGIAKRHAAIDIDDRAGDVFSVVSRKEKRGVGDIGFGAVIA